LKNLFLKVSRKSREKRAEIFRSFFAISENTKILDIGSEDGSNINFYLQGTKARPENVYLADIDERVIELGKERFGYKAIFLDESGKLPFADDFFDIVFCSSVIEHVTIGKEKVWEMTDEKEFSKLSFERQTTLANEIQRVGCSFFVQTPNRNFIFETHSWLPFIGFLPRPLMVKALKFFNRFWIKLTTPDFNLLDKKQMQTLFPQAEIISERKFGMIKSIIAIKNEGKSVD
jgi:SAM-dependent methyltransferase